MENTPYTLLHDAAARRYFSRSTDTAPTSNTKSGPAHWR